MANVSPVKPRIVAGVNTSWPRFSPAFLDSILLYEGNEQSVKWSFITNNETLTRFFEPRLSFSFEEEALLALFSYYSYFLFYSNFHASMIQSNQKILKVWRHFWRSEWSIYAINLKNIEIRFNIIPQIDLISYQNFLNFLLFSFPF